MLATSTAQGHRPATERTQATLVLDPVYQADFEPLALTPGNHTLGSAADCSLRLQVAGVQPRHALIIVTRQRVLMQALNERTWVNEIPAVEAVLQVGDRLAIGPVEFQLRAGDSAPDAPQPSVFQQPAPAAVPPMVERTPTTPLSTNIEAELVEQIRRLQEEIVEQDKKLQAGLERRAAAPTLPATPEPQPQGFERAQRRIKQAKRKEALVRSLMAELKTHTEMALKRQRELEQRQTQLTQHQDDLDRRAEELRHNEELLVKQRAELEQAQPQIDRESANLTAQTASLADERARVEAREQELSQRSEELDAKNRELDRETEKLRRRHAEFNERQAHMEQQKEQLETQEADTAGDIELNSSQRAQLEADRAVLAASREELQQEWDALDESRASLDETRAQLESDRKELEAGLADLDTRQKSLVEETSTLQQQREQLEQDRQEFESRTGDLDARRTSLDEEQSALQQQREQLEQDRRDFESQTADLESRQASLETEMSTLQQQREQLEHDRAELSAREQELESQKTQLADERAQHQQSVDESAKTDEGDSETQAELQMQLAELESERELLARERQSIDEQRERLGAEAQQLQIERQELLAQARQQQGSPADSTDAKSRLEWEKLQAGQGAASFTDNFGPGVGSDPDAEKSISQIPESQEEVSELRDTLAGMFGLETGELTERSASPAETGEALPSLQEPPREPSPPVEQFPTSPGLPPLAAEPMATEPQMAGPSAGPVAGGPATDTGEAEAAEDDSIAAYMERLLARNRQGAGSGTEFQSVATPSPQPSPQPRPQPTPLVSQAPPGGQQPTAQFSEIDASETAAPLTEPPQPRHQQDKEAARANLNSLREVANMSARTAIATHTGKQLRGKVLLKCLLAGSSFVVSAALLSGSQWGFPGYTLHGWGALAVGGIMAVELARSTIKMRRKQNVGSNSSAKDAESPE